VTHHVEEGGWRETLEKLIHRLPAAVVAAVVVDHHESAGDYLFIEMFEADAVDSYQSASRWRTAIGPIERVSRGTVS
jgi:hypothetical protein